MKYDKLNKDRNYIKLVRRPDKKQVIAYRLALGVLSSEQHGYYARKEDPVECSSASN